MIRLEGLTIRAGDFTLRDVSLDVPPGGYALIIGPTGSGKTTLLEAVAGHARHDRGRVVLHDRDVTGLPPERRGVGYVHQRYHLFPHLSVGDNIRYGLGLGWSEATRTARVAELASLLGLSDLLHRGTRGLSGGETQRVALARALAPRPSVLLLDEPFSALDPATRQTLRRELRALHEREGTTTLQVTHDFGEALRLGDLVAVLAEGRILQHGRPEEVFRYPNSAFVASFIGSGNVIAGEVRAPPEAGPSGPAFAAQFHSGPLRLDVIAERLGPAHAVLRPEDIMVSRHPLSASARNHVAGRVTRLEPLGPITQVHVDAGLPLTAAITSASVASLHLRTGETVVLTFKATAIHLV